MWYKWLWLWNDSWCQTGWFEYLRNGWFPFYTQQSLKLAENGAKNKKTYRVQQFCGHKRVFNEGDQRRRARLVKANRKVTVTKITSNYNSGMKKSITEHTMRQTTKCMTTAAEYIVSQEPRWPSGLRRWFANATPRETGFRIPPLPRAEFGRVKLEWHNWLVTPGEGGGLSI